MDSEFRFKLRNADFVKVHLKNAPARILEIWSVEDVLYLKNEKNEDRVIINNRLCESRKPVMEDDVVRETNGNGLEVENIEIIR